MLGRHDGIHRFTVGQRKGLGLSASPTGAPLYVLALDAAERQVVVGPKASLERTTLTASGVNWIVEPPSGSAARRRADPPPASGSAGDGARARATGRAEVIFDAPQMAITPGQAVVFYEATWSSAAGGSTEGRGQRPEARGQRAEGRGQMLPPGQSVPSESTSGHFLNSRVPTKR